MKTDKFPSARCPAMATRNATALLMGALSLAATGARAADEATPAPSEDLAEVGQREENETSSGQDGPEAPRPGFVFEIARSVDRADGDHARAWRALVTAHDRYRRTAVFRRHHENRSNVGPAPHAA